MQTKLFFTAYFKGYCLEFLMVMLPRIAMVTASYKHGGYVSGKLHV